MSKFGNPKMTNRCTVKKFHSRTAVCQWRYRGWYIWREEPGVFKLFRPWRGFLGEEVPLGRPRWDTLAAAERYVDSGCFATEQVYYGPILKEPFLSLDAQA